MQCMQRIQSLRKGEPREGKFARIAAPQCASGRFYLNEKLLKPGGALILTVPFMIEESQTREHFPHLFDLS